MVSLAWLGPGFGGRTSLPARAPKWCPFKQDRFRTSSGFEGSRSGQPGKTARPPGPLTPHLIGAGIDRRDLPDREETASRKYRPQFCAARSEQGGRARSACTARLAPFSAATGQKYGPRPRRARLESPSPARHQTSSQEARYRHKHVRMRSAARHPGGTKNAPRFTVIVARGAECGCDAPREPSVPRIPQASRAGRICAAVALFSSRRVISRAAEGILRPTKERLDRMDSISLGAGAAALTRRIFRKRARPSARRYSGLRYHVCAAASGALFAGPWFISAVALMCPIVVLCARCVIQCGAPAMRQSETARR